MVIASRVSVKPGLWTPDWTHGLDCGLRFGLDFGLMLHSMTAISNNKFPYRPETSDCTIGAACKHMARGRADYFLWRIGEVHLLRMLGIKLRLGFH